MDESGEASHGDGSNTPSDEEYGDMMVEERPDKGGIDDAAYENYIGAEVMIDVPVEGPMRATVRHCVE